MLSHFRHDQGIPVCLPVDLFYDEGAGEHIVMIFKRVFLLVGFNLLNPFMVILGF